MAGKGSAPGEYRGGRKKGTPNKRTVDASALMQSMGYDPLAAMIKIAQDEDEAPDVRAMMHRELAQYAYPKRKAIEMSGPQGEPVTFVMKLGN